MSGAMVDACELAERALAGGSGAGRVVLVEETVEAEVRYANNTVTTNGTRRDRQTVVVSFDARGDGVASGTASGSGAVEIADLVALAERNAASSPLADDAFELVAGEASDDFGDDPGTTGIDTLQGVIDHLGEIFGRAEDKGTVRAGFATHRVTTTYLASSTGVRRRFVQPGGRVEHVGRAADGTRSAWAGIGTNWFDDVDLAVLEERVARRLEWAERKIELSPGRYETILPPDAVADLILVLDWDLSGKEAEEGRNVFSAPGGATRIGERLTELPFMLRSDPGEDGLESEPWVLASASSADQSVFDNGAPVGPTAWIDDGSLRRLRYHRAGATRSGATFTPPVDNLVLSCRDAGGDVDDLVSRTERGLLLTCLWYIRPVDPATLLLTGLTRDGIYLVENGEVSGAVNNFRFNESPVDMLARTTEVGRTRRALSREWGEWLPRTAMPALRVADFNMSSVSPAT